MNIRNKADETSPAHFHAELTSIFTFTERRWSQRNFSENRHKQCKQLKILLKKYEDYEEIFFFPPDVSVTPHLLKVPNTNMRYAVTSQ